MLGGRCRLPVTGPTLRLDAPKDRERLSNTVQIHLSFTPPDCTHNFVHTGTIINPPRTGDLIVVNHWQHCHAPTVPFVPYIIFSIFPKASPSAVGLIGAC